MLIFITIFLDYILLSSIHLISFLTILNLKFIYKEFKNIMIQIYSRTKLTNSSQLSITKLISQRIPNIPNSIICFTNFQYKWYKLPIINNIRMFTIFPICRPTSLTITSKANIFIFRIFKGLIWFHIIIWIFSYIKTSTIFYSLDRLSILDLSTCMLKIIFPAPFQSWQ